MQNYPLREHAFCFLADYFPEFKQTNYILQLTHPGGLPGGEGRMAPRDPDFPPRGEQRTHPLCYTFSKHFPGEGGKKYSCAVQSSGLTLMQKEKNTYQKILTEVVKSAGATSGHRFSDWGLSFLGNPWLGFLLHPRGPAWHLLGVCPRGPAGIEHPAETRLVLRTGPRAARVENCVQEAGPGSPPTPEACQLSPVSG